MININQENLIPVLDVRKFIPVSIPTLRRWTAAGKLETVRAGSKVFTSREALQRMLEPGPQMEREAPTVRHNYKGSEHTSRHHDELMKLLGGLDN